MIRTGALLIAFLALNACQKEEHLPQVAAPETEITEIRQSGPETVKETCGMLIHGDGFSGKFISLGSNNDESSGIFSPDGGITYFTMKGEKGMQIDGIFSGNQPGQSQNNCSMTFSSGGKTYVADNSARITLNEYGGAGGKISGSFSGTFKRFDVHPVSGKQLVYPVIISKGKFSVTRKEDLSHKRN